LANKRLHKAVVYTLFSTVGAWHSA